MTTSRFNQPLGGNDMPRFAGPATMMRLPDAADRQGARRLLRRRADRHRHLQPPRHAPRAAPDPGRILHAPPLQHGDRRRALRVLAGRRHRRRGDQHLRPEEDASTSSRRPMTAILAAWLHPADAGRRPHADAAHPARDEEEARAGGADPCRRPCRHQRHDVRRDDRPRHALPPRGGGGPAAQRQGVPDRPARHGLFAGGFRLAAQPGLHGGAGRGVLVQVAERR